MWSRRGPGSPAAGSRAFLLASVFVLLPAAGGAHDPPRLAAVVVSGNEAVPSAEIVGAVPLRRGAVLTDSSLSTAAAAVTRLYRSRAYFGAAASATRVNFSSDSAAADLAIAIREGVRATFGRLVVRGSDLLSPEEAADLFPFSPGDPLAQEGLDRGIAALLGGYQRAGYPFAAASVAAIDDAGGGAMTVTVEVADGGPAAIDEIRVVGNTETKRDVIVREARMDVPGFYDPAKVAGFAARLRRLGIFSSVAEPSLYAAGGGHGLLVSVVEGRTSTFDGILGYAPEGAGSSGGSFTGSAAVAFRNLFGTGRKLDAAWTRLARSTQEIRLAYEEPWAFGIPVNLGGAFYQRQQDSSYVDTRLRLSAEYLATASLSISGVGEWQDVVPSSGPAGAGVPGSSSTTWGAVVRYDTRDDRELPRSGADFRTEYRTGRKTPSEGSAGKESVRHIGFDFEFFLPVRERQVLALALHGREVSTASPGPGDLYRLGGFRTLRGFREDQFIGPQTAWGTAEYRFLAGGRSFFCGFFDPGYVAGGGGAGDIFTYGYGVGMRLETGIGLIGVSFALGEGQPIAETKIHFGLINDF